MRPHLRKRLASRDILLVFAFLALSSYLIPTAIGVYASPISWALFLPSYVVTMLFYDGILGLEHAAYAVQGFVPVDGHFLWEAGNVATYYLFAVAAAWLGNRLRRFTASLDTHETA